MNLNSLKYASGSRKNRKRVGRGIGSGHGKTSCRGHKGQKSRSGGTTSATFEGGQMPLQRRLPKRGFNNLFRKEYQVLNLQDLEQKVTEKTVSPEDMYKLRMIDKKNALVKILGDGEITKALEVSAHAFSKSAVEKIEKAGGKVIKL